MTPRLIGTVLMLALTFACGVGVGTITTPQHVLIAVLAMTEGEL